MVITAITPWRLRPVGCSRGTTPTRRFFTQQAPSSPSPWCATWLVPRVSQVSVGRWRRASTSSPTAVGRQIVAQPSENAGQVSVAQEVAVHRPRRSQFIATSVDEDNEAPATALSDYVAFVNAVTFMSVRVGRAGWQIVRSGAGERARPRRGTRGQGPEGGRRWPVRCRVSATARSSSSVAKGLRNSWISARSTPCSVSIPSV